MRNLTELNLNDGGRPVQRPPPSADDVRAFQAHFGVTLPNAYLKLLHFANGGSPELDLIQPAGRPDDEAWGVDHFYFLSDDKTASRSLWSVAETWRPHLGPQALAFAEDGGGNQFFMDLGVTPPSVKVFIHDEDFAVVDLAPSFEAFIDALSLDPDAI